MITDRTSQDVARWKMLHDKGWAAMTDDERSEWLGEMKGRYTYTDMNRVENAVKDLSDRFVEIGYLAAPLTVKTDWNRWSAPTVSDFNRYYGNIASLRALVAGYPTTPDVPTVNRRLDYSMANDIEQILEDLENIITKLPQSWYYAGEIFSGEV